MLSDIFTKLTDINLLTLKQTSWLSLLWTLSSLHKESSLICLLPTQIHPSFKIQYFLIITSTLIDLFLCSLASNITLTFPFLYKPLFVPLLLYGTVFIMSQQLTPKPLGNKIYNLHMGLCIAFNMDLGPEKTFCIYSFLMTVHLIV